MTVVQAGGPSRENPGVSELRCGRGWRIPSAQRDDVRVEIEVLLVSDCSHGKAAGALLREALDDVGLASTTFRTTIITSNEEAQARSFAGSPSFLVGGRDLFPIRGQGRLTCRLYQT